MNKTSTAFILSILVLFISFSCSNDDDSNSVNPSVNPCSDSLSVVFIEKDAFIQVEMEDADLIENWKNVISNDASGQRYIVWEGEQSLGNPGQGLLEFKLSISDTGVYRFNWFSTVTIGDNGTEHNDSWLRFPDADSFFGEKNNGNSIVYPKGSGNTPNPNGSSKDGWFKIYRSGNDLSLKWQASTSDNDAHDIYVEFNNPGIYTMQVSARSAGHGIDKFILYKESDYTKGEAEASVVFSETTCN
jgi:hypothetical protein